MSLNFSLSFTNCGQMNKRKPYKNSKRLKFKRDKPQSKITEIQERISNEKKV